MADTTIHGLTELVASATDDEVGIWDANVSQYKRITRANLLDGALAAYAPLAGAAFTGATSVTRSTTSTSQVFAQENYLTVTTVAPGANYAALYAQVQENGDSYLDTIEAIDATAIFNSTHVPAGVAKSVYAIRLKSQNTGTGFATHVIGWKVNTPVNSGGGTIGITFGGYIAPQTVAGAGDGSALHIEGAGITEGITWSGGNGATLNTRLYSTAAGFMRFDCTRYMTHLATDVNVAFRLQSTIGGAATTFGIHGVSDSFGGWCGIALEASPFSINGINSGDINLASAGGVTTVGGNLKVGGTAVRGTTEGTVHIDIFNGTAPVGTLANGCSIFATGGELYTMDASGNASIQSPHDKDGNWIFLSKNTVTGRTLKVDMEKMMTAINEHFNWDFVHEYQEAVA